MSASQVKNNYQERRRIGWQRASEYVLSADTEGHSFGNARSSELISVMPLTVIEASYCCALFRDFMAREIQFRTKSFHLSLLYEKKTHINQAVKNVALNFPTQHVRLERQFIN
jgi:hypothetical protein